MHNQSKLFMFLCALKERFSAGRMERSESMIESETLYSHNFPDEFHTQSGTTECPSTVHCIYCPFV